MHQLQSQKRLPWEAEPARELIRMAWPITLSGLSFASMGVVDTVLIARLGEAQLAGVGLGAMVTLGVLGFGFGTLRGVKVLLAQAHGTGSVRDQRSFVAAGLMVALWLGLTMACLGQLAALGAARFAASPEAARAVRTYVSIRTLGAPIIMVYVALREARYGRAQTRLPMISALIGNLTHAALDYVAVYRLHMGVAGAAYANLAAFSLQAAILLSVELREGIVISWQAFRAQWAVLRMGIFTGLQWLVEIGSLAMLSAVLAGVSDGDIAAHQVALQVTAFSFLPALSLAEAATVLVAQAVGIGRVGLVPRVARATLLLSLCYAGFCASMFLVAGAQIAGVFSSEPRLVTLFRWVLATAAVHQIFDATTAVGHGVLRGAGAQRTSASIAAGCSWLCTPLLGFVLVRSFGLGAPGGWIAMSVEMMAASTLIWLYISRLGWVPAARRSRRQLRRVAAPYAA